MSTDDLSRDAVAAVDRTGQTAEVLGLAEHLGDALWRVDTAQISGIDSPGGVVVAGMGGFALGGQLASAAFGDRQRRPIVTVHDYRLPSYVDDSWLVFCASYSGQTEETLALYDAAKAIGAKRVVCSTSGALVERARADKVPVVPVPGGFAARAAVGYAFGVATEIAALAGAGPSLTSELEGAATLIERLAGEWGPDSPEHSRAKALARGLEGVVPVIAGAELTAPVAYRWKCQFNENAKLHAFSHTLPELDHNELLGWRDSGHYGKFAAILLDDPETDPRTRARIELTAELIEGACAVTVCAGEGDTRCERLASLVFLGDLVSLYSAVLRGVDPAEADVLTELQQQLADR